MSKSEEIQLAVDSIKKDDDAKKEAPSATSAKVDELTKENEELKEKVKDLLSKIPLAQKVANANREIGTIAKDGANKRQNYSFQSEAAIKAAVQRVSSKNGFAIVPNFEIIQKYDKQTRNGGTWTFYDVMGTFTITDGKDTLVGSMPGTGSDSGDKAVQKATTSAQKYFYKQLFNITDRDEDPDATDSSPDGGYSLDAGATPMSLVSQLTYEQLQKYPAVYADGDVKTLQEIWDLASSRDEMAVGWWHTKCKDTSTMDGCAVIAFTKKNQNRR